MSKKCRTFNGFMKTVGALTMEQAERMGIDMSEIEDHGGYASIKACYPNQPIIDAILKKYKLYPATRTITDVDEGGISTVDTYSTGFHYVDREDWFLCKKNVDAWLEEANPSADDDYEDEEK